MKINPWYFTNVIAHSEGLKYIPAEYYLEIIEEIEDDRVLCKIVFNDEELFYDIPKSQIIKGEE